MKPGHLGTIVDYVEQNPGCSTIEVWRGLPHIQRAYVYSVVEKAVRLGILRYGDRRSDRGRARPLYTRQLVMDLPTTSLVGGAR